jgi:hypothetical protein
MDNSDIVLVFVVILLLLLFLGFVWYVTRPPPTTGSNLLDLIRYNQNWRYDTATISKPYVFQLGAPGAMTISYFDDAGYLQGFVVLQATYRMTSPNDISIQITNIVSNPSKTPIAPNWSLSYVDPSHLKVNNGSSTFIVRLS